MIEPPGASPTAGPPDDYLDYAASEQRRTLFRVLAANLVRELRNSGYHGSELLGFVAQLMEAVTESGFSAGSPAEMPDGESAAGVDVEIRTDPRGRPSIRGPRLLLRPPAESDRPALDRWRADPLVRESLALPLLEEIARHVSNGASGRRVDLLMCDPKSGRPFGAVSLYRIDDAVRQAEVGKMISEPEYRGLGLAGAATAMLLRYGFEVLDLNRVYLRTLGGNLKNIRLNERIGFRFEGVLRSAFLMDGAPRDVVLMGMLRSEFEERHGSRAPEANGEGAAI